MDHDGLDRILFDHAFLGLGIGIVILIAGLGWGYGHIAAGVHTVTYLMLNGAINVFGHVTGSQPHPNTAGNNQWLAWLAWLAWLTAGEGFHSNHHAAGSAARLSFANRQEDPGWRVIRFVAWRGLAEVRLSAPRFVRASAAVRP